LKFLKPLHERIRRGEITCTVRLWQRCHVRVGGLYALPPGSVRVTRVFETTVQDITPELARRSGFAGVVDLLKVARHGPGRRVFVMDFEYVSPAGEGSVEVLGRAAPDRGSRKRARPRS
jgi:hypothetical protein